MFIIYRIYAIIPEAYSEPSQNLRWSFQPFTFFRKKFHLDVWLDSEYPSTFLIRVWCRNSPPELFCKKCVLRNFGKSTERQLCQSRFLNKVTGLRPVKKKRLWNRCFPVNFVKFLKTPFFIEHFWWLVLMYFNGRHVSHHIKTSTRRNGFHKKQCTDPIILKQIFYGIFGQKCLVMGK